MTGAALRMSREAIDWVFQDAPGVPSQCVSVLVALAHGADKQGCGAYLSAGTLAGYARKSKRQVHYDLLQLAELKLIRPGDQARVAKYPVNRRPVVYDLAMELRQDSGVQPTSPPAGVQPTSQVKPIAPLQSTAPQMADDQEERPGVQSASPQDAGSLGCNTAQPGVQPTADKLNPELNPYMAEVVTKGGSGGEDPKRAARPKRPRRDLNAGREDVERLCTHLAERIIANGCRVPAINQDWRDAARLMLDKDHLSEEHLHAVIDWCQNSEFWRSNILSMPTLREKYDQLRLQAQRSRSGSGGTNGQGPPGAPGPNRARAWMAAGRQVQEAIDNSGRELPA
jgi:hypothetical protein